MISQALGVQGSLLEFGKFQSCVHFPRQSEVPANFLALLCALRYVPIRVSCGTADPFLVSFITESSVVYIVNINFTDASGA